MTVVIQIFYHMIMPAMALLLWFFPFRNVRLGLRTVLLSGVYPIVYSVFSILRGRLLSPAYYPYPFYDPAFVWNTLMKDRPMNLAAAYAIIGAGVIVFGAGLFMALAALLVHIHNRRIDDCAGAESASLSRAQQVFPK